MKRKRVKSAVSLICIASLIFGDLSLGNIDFKLFADADEVSVDSEVEINETNFPDENFRNYVKENYDIDGDGKLSVSECAEVISIGISFKEIETLEGIESFTNIESLDCSANNLTSLDVSGLTNLDHLWCEGNSLTNLDVSGLTNLEYLECKGNNLTDLDVSGLTNLTYLYCDDNELTNLDMSGLTNLTYLHCYNNELTNLDVSGLTNLTSLCCYDNELTNLDVSGLTNLTALYCFDNELTNLDVSELTNLTYLYCYNNELTNLNVSGLTNLTSLCCYDNELTNLDVSGLTNLEHLECEGNNLTDLDVSGLTNLTYLYCDDNELTNLDVSRLTNLTMLSCARNNLYTLKVNEDFSGYLNTDNNYYFIKSQGNTTEISMESLPGLDVSKISNVAGGTIENGVIKFDGDVLSYDYEIGNGTVQTFKLYLENDANKIEINESNFPDENFRSWVQENYDTDGDGTLTAREWVQIEVVFIRKEKIKTLEGIEYFSNLKWLSCGWNELTNLDVSELTNLTWLSCEGNNLTNLDVSGLTNLEDLGCAGNNLTSLDVSGLTNLSTLLCDSNNLYTLKVNEDFSGYLNADNNYYVVENQGNATEISVESLPGLDVSKISNVVGGTIENGVIKFDGTILTYDYEIGNGTTQTFGLYLLNDTGIEVTYEDGTLPAAGTRINILDVTEEETYQTYISAAEAYGQVGGLFDISMISEGVVVQPEGTVRVSIPLPEGMSASTAKVYYIDESGNSTDMNAIYKDGKLIFVTDHFSVYAVVSSGMKGDANGDGKINIKDSALVRRYAAGWAVEIDESVSDVNGDGKINIKDSALIRRYVAGWAVEFN